VQDEDRPLAEQIHRLLVALYSRIKDHEQACVERFRVSRPQAKALYRLEPGETVPVGTLAERADTDPSNLTATLVQLEERGLIERGRAAHDRRVRVVGLTPEGEALRKRLVEDMFGAYPGVSALSEEERRALRDLLARLREPR
jgi:DNA-binding MarR family transcriptional regulator